MLDALKQWSRRAQTWAKGKEPTGLQRIATKTQLAALPHDVFIYCINGAKQRAPVAARKLISIHS